MAEHFDERYRMQSLGSALDILECFSRAGPELGVSELSALVGVSKGAVHKVLANLADRGYIIRNEKTSKYRLGLRLWELGMVAVRDLQLRDVAAPQMHELTSATGESTHLAVYDAGEVVYVDKIASDHAVQAYTRVGGRAPAYCVATGKALLAEQRPAELERLIESGVKRFTDLTLTEPDALREDLEASRLRGYALNRGEWRADVVGVAAPVFGPAGTVLGAVGISGPKFRLSVDNAHEQCGAVIHTAKSISAKVGAG